MADNILKKQLDCISEDFLAGIFTGLAKPAWGGLRDMFGNAAEWTSTDATFTDGVARKVVCGGSFNDRPHRALMRWGYPAWMRPFDVGFRIAVSSK